MKRLTFLFSIMVMLLVSGVIPSPAEAAVSVLGSWVTGISHTKESGSNRALIFIAHAESTSTINLSSVSYGGQAMTKVVDYSYNAVSGYAYAAAFILKESGVAAASNSNFTVTWSGTAPGSAGYSSVFLANVNQTTATGATGTGGRTSNPVTTSALATASGDMVILAATCGNAGSYTLNNSFTEGTDQQIGGTVTGVTGRKSATGANETPSATYSSTINRQMIIGLVVKGSSGGSTLSVSPTSLNVAAAAGSTGTFNITSNVSWTVSSNQTWLTVSPTSGSNNATVTVTAQQNSGSSSRQATVTVSGSGVSSQTVTVSQSGSGGGTWSIQPRCFQDGPSGSFDDIAVKDPSIVNSGGRYHLFYTGKDSSNWRMGYASATSISGLSSATHTYMSSLNGGSYFCAPQVFYFGAKGKWYLIYQSGQGATYSTNSDVGNPSGWAAGRGMGFGSGAVDFWCISDGSNVYCFYSPQDGSHTIKRRSTSVANFPSGWSGESTICSDTFEAPHVYKNNADGKYYMMVEDISRHFELWTATSLGGTWTKVDENWANVNNATFTGERWTNQISHGEILRAGTGETMPISSINSCQVLIQGTTGSGDYGSLPYDLGLMSK
jgi:hypothetical protein